MAKTDTCENGLLDLLFCNANFAGVGDSGGLRGSVASGYLWISLHTASPGESGNQSTNEVSYTGYARHETERIPDDWTVSGDLVKNTVLHSFPACTGGYQTATYFGVGVAASGAGKLLYYGELSPHIVCQPGVTPQIASSAVIEEK